MGRIIVSRRGGVGRKKKLGGEVWGEKRTRRGGVGRKKN